jgi:hypothetical protein
MRPSIAGTESEGGKPVDPGCAGRANLPGQERGTASGALRARPVEIAFETEQYPIAETRIVDAERAAGNASIGREIAGRPAQIGPIALSNAIAAIDADIDAAPIDRRLARSPGKSCVEAATLPHKEAAPVPSTRHDWNLDRGRSLAKNEVNAAGDSMRREYSTKTLWPAAIRPPLVHEKQGPRAAAGRGCSRWIRMCGKINGN